jgi:tetratricopeptide (TPR) repeat protein
VRRATIDVFRKYQGSGFQTLDAEGFERLGDALIQLRLFEEAGAELSLGVARFPEVRSLRLRLAQTLGELGRYDDAEIHYKTLLDKRASLRR